MTIHDFKNLLQRCPLVASVQASPNSPLANVPTLVRLAQASAQEGVLLLRLEGVDSISAIREATKLPTIGLIKEPYPNSEIYITPTAMEVGELIGLGCEIIALDGTPRPRPGGETLAELVRQIKTNGRLAMADCDSLGSARYAVACGADIVGTTLSGYTTVPEGAGCIVPAPVSARIGPDIGLVRQLARELNVPILAEGRYAEPRQAQLALRAGATGVVVGGALNDPVKQTRAFVTASKRIEGPIGAVDIGGTWIRFAIFDSDWNLLNVEKTAVQPDRDERLGWIRTQASATGVTKIGISTGGTVDPETYRVWEAKEIIPNHVGTDFASLGLALNDGLASAWGHACLPQYAGKRVATLALGTGVGFGLVDRGRIFIGPRGEYPRLNDLIALDGLTFEDILGGANLTEDRKKANQVARKAVEIIRQMFSPDVIVLCGGVGLSDWLEPDLPRSPFGEHAGLYGAAALALYPPILE